jgi:repressor LexA
MAQNEERDARMRGKEQAALAYIERCVRERGYPPTVREIAEHLHYGSSESGARIIDRLSERGLLRVERGLPRAITITETGMKQLTEDM